MSRGKGKNKNQPPEKLSSEQLSEADENQSSMEEVGAEVVAPEQAREDVPGKYRKFQPKGND